MLLKKCRSKKCVNILSVLHQNTHTPGWLPPLAYLACLSQVVGEGQGECRLPDKGAATKGRQPSL